MNIARFAPLVAAGLFALGVAGCENTVRGFGQDMQKTGKAIEKATGGTSGGSTAQPAAQPAAPAARAAPSPSAAPAAPTPLKN